MSKKRGKQNNVNPRLRTEARKAAPPNNANRRPLGGAPPENAGVRAGSANSRPDGKTQAQPAPRTQNIATLAPSGRGAPPEKNGVRAGSANSRPDGKTQAQPAPRTQNIATLPPAGRSAPPERRPTANQTAPQNNSRGPAQNRGTKSAPSQKDKRPPDIHPSGKRPPAQNKGGKAQPGRNRQPETVRGAKSQPGKLHAQTAAERRRHIAERQGFTPEQLEYLRRRSAIKRYYIKKNRISAITLFFTRLMMLVIIYVTLFAVSSGLFWLGLGSYNHSKSEDIVYQIGENNNDEDYKLETLSYRDRVRGGQLYLNFTELAEYFGFVTTGDTGELRYLTKYAGGEEAVFEVGTSSVTINGSMTRMPVVSYYDDGALYIPLDFVTTYIKGISAGKDEKTDRLVIYREYTLNAKGEKIYNDITFSLKPQEPSEHIDENTLPADIKLATEPAKKPVDTTGTQTTGTPVGTDLTG